MARTVFLISGSGGINENLFGSKSFDRKPYSEIVKEWESKRRVVETAASIFIYPICAVYEVLKLPLTIFKYFFSEKSQIDRNTLKPPV